MAMPQKKIIIFGLLIIVFLIPLLWFTTIKISNHNTYNKLEKIALSQPFANKLGEPQRKSIECYPPGRLSSTCLALFYTLDKDSCLEVAKSLDDKNDCEYVTTTEQTDGKDITYTMSKNGSSYRLDVIAQ